MGRLHLRIRRPEYALPLPNYDEAYAVLDSEVGQSWLQKAQEDTTTIPLAFFDIGFRELTCNNEVHTPDDLKGVKIRVMPDPIQTATWEALGCAVTPVAYSELYTALQQGMVDAQENPPSNIVSSKVYELQNYMVMTNHNFTATIPAISPVIWNQLSADDQQLIRDVMVEAQNEGRKHTAELADGFIQKVEDDAGTKVIYLTDDELKAFQDKVKGPSAHGRETDGYRRLQRPDLLRGGLRGRQEISRPGKRMFHCNAKVRKEIHT